MTTEALSLAILTSANMPSQNSIDYQKLSNLELAVESGKHDMVAFEELYNRHHRQVFSICLRMLQNSHEAEDLTQDVFLQLYRKVHTFQGDSQFSTWLHRLTVNQVLMYFRKHNNKYGMKKLVFVDSSDIPDIPVLGTADYQKMSVDHQIALENAIEQLAPGYKKVFILHDIEGYQHEEIAKLLGFSIGTSKSQLHKARLKLQKLLKKVANPRLISGKPTP